MKIGVVVFPGSNCDRDLIEVLSSITHTTVEELWHKSSDLKGCTHIFLPGGFSFGDYLRSGALAKISPIMQELKVFAQNGGKIIGICNGFQILCESNLLPGALLRNENRKFVCKDVYLKANSNAVKTQTLSHIPYKVPIAHGEGRYFADTTTLNNLKKNNQILFTYCSAEGSLTEDSNPNGSVDNIAGICNETGNVIGMMPHPERCASDFLYNVDGKAIIKAFLKLS
ncbi:MAG: phosphoribosylformylglycinamidine synthase subunit PurQ [Bacteroidia bacterium]|nr:phosphoribosylformylglycinamidine synthase subunit PurQ [Bacteroidia bacterium]